MKKSRPIELNEDRFDCLVQQIIDDEWAIAKARWDNSGALLKALIEIGFEKETAKLIEDRATDDGVLTFDTLKNAIKFVCKLK